MKVLLRLYNPFNKIDRSVYKSDPAIWITVILLWVVSLLIVYSSAGSMLIDASARSSTFLIKQMVFIAIGFIVVFVTHKINYAVFLKYSFSFYWICVCLLAITLIFGTEINGAKRWLHVPLVNILFQPSDLAKVAIVMYMSKKIAQNQQEITTYKEFFMVFILPIAIVSLLIMPENLSTALLISVNCVILLFIGRASIKYLFYTFSLVLILPLSFILILAVSFYNKGEKKSDPLPKVLQISRLPTWVKRVQGFIYEDKASSNYQIMQANIAIAKGRWVGVGPGNSEQRYFLPSSYADYIYSIWIEEYGMLGAIGILILYLFFFFRCIKIFVQCEYAYGAFVAIGLGVSVIFQAFVNIGVNVNLIPNTGVTLPLISMGGTSYLASCFGIGVILSVAKHLNDVNELKTETNKLYSEHQKNNTHV